MHINFNCKSNNDNKNIITLLHNEYFIKQLTITKLYIKKKVYNYYSSIIIKKIINSWYNSLLFSPLFVF